MQKADKIKLLSLIGISLILFLSGCVDTSVQPIPSSFNFRSQVKIVNLAPGTGSASVSMDIASGGSMQFGPVAFGDEAPTSGQAFSDIPAGAKTFNITYSSGVNSDVFKLVTDTDYKMRLFIVSDTAANSRDFIKATERYIWQQKGTDNGKKLFPADTAQLALFNGCPDITVDQVIFHNTAGGEDVSVDVNKGGFKSGMPYQKVAAGNYNVFVVAGSDTVTTISFDAQAQVRSTAVLYDRLSSLKNKIFTDD